MALAATTARAHVFEAFLSDSGSKALMHWPYFSGYPLACAAANASLDLFEREPRLEQVARIEAQLRRELEPAKKISGVVDVRVKGAIGVIELEAMSDINAMKRRFVEEGVFIRPFGKIVYTTPPLVTGEADLARLTGAMLKVVGEQAA
jgi:adenosylmethionine-8-amino-7-oxononanoate aminotransferase